MHARRELDSIIAEKAMGWTITWPIDNTCDFSTSCKEGKRNFGINPATGEEEVIPLYSTDIAAWQEVFNKIKDMGKELKYLINLALLCDVFAVHIFTWQEVWTLMDAPLEKKCIAALKAVGVDV